MTAMLVLALPTLLALASPPAHGGQGEPQEVVLRAKVVRSWSFDLPEPGTRPVGAGIAFGDRLGAHFAAERDGTGIAIDTDGDGGTDVVVTGENGFVTLKGTVGAGRPLDYAVRLTNQGDGWHFASSTVLVGKIGRTRIQLIDQNNNGSFADFGEDAIAIGRSDRALFLSRVLAVRNELFSVEMAEDGSRLLLTPFEGAVGTLDLASGFVADAKLVSALVVGADGQTCFELGRGPVKVPAGTYRLHSGLVALGDAELGIRRGKARDLAVTADSTLTLEWGSPHAEFDYARQGDQMVFTADRIRYFGTAGEQYVGWNPVGKAPEFTIEKDGEVFASAILPGSC